MNINNPTTFSTPDLTLSTSNSSGTAGALRADDTVLVYDTSLPDAITYGQSGATGSSATAARRDHAHAMAASDTVTAASVAEMKAASSTTVYASPGRTQNHPGVSKGWVQFEQTGTHGISASYNCDGVADASQAGKTTITWGTDFDTDDYAIAGITDNTRCINDVTRAAASLVIQVIRTTDGSAEDSDNVSILTMGYQT